MKSFVAIAFMFTVFSITLSAQEQSFAGLYHANTQSNWAMHLTLLENHRAKFTYIVMDNECDSCANDIGHTLGTWEQVNATIILTTDNGDPIKFKVISTERLELINNEYLNTLETEKRTFYKKNGPKKSP